MTKFERLPVASNELDGGQITFPGHCVGLSTRREQMNDSTSVEWLSKAIGQAAKSAKFCVVGRLPVGNPGIEVEGLGAITLPLKVPSSRLSLLKCLQAALPTCGLDMMR
jgi:hypothetical protein